jgi:hypothetical protein
MSDFISKKRLKWEIEKWYDKEYYSSFNAAVYKTLIKIIDKFPSVELEPKTSDDCVSRTDILRKLENLCNNTCEYSKKQRKTMCDSCNLDLVIHMVNNARSVSSNQKSSDDCVSRQAAIEALSHMMDTDGFRDGWAVSRSNVDCMLRSLPSVEPERKTGKWIRAIDPDVNAWIGGHTCSECGRACVQMSMNYCANCGAKMEVKTDHS